MVNLISIQFQVGEPVFRHNALSEMTTIMGDVMQQQLIHRRHLESLNNYRFHSGPQNFKLGWGGGGGGGGSEPLVT